MTPALDLHNRVNFGMALIALKPSKSLSLLSLSSAVVPKFDPSIEALQGKFQNSFNFGMDQSKIWVLPSKD